MAAVAALPAVEIKRLFISGIASNLTQEELVQRLQSYGEVTEELVLNKKNESTSGIFGHCNLRLDPAAWSRLRKLSGTVLKGSKLRIEEAKQDWVVRKALDEQRPQPAAPNPRKRPPPGTIPAVESRRVKRGEVIKDSSIAQKSRKQGWIKGRYGRAIAILKNKDGVKVPRNPDALSRLWGSAHPKPDQLTYYYDDEEEEWHDRRGRVIREPEIMEKKQPTELRQGGRVEVWGSDEDTDERPEGQPGQAMGYVPASEDAEMEETMDEEQIDAQLVQERSAGLDMLRDMFKDSQKQAEVKTQQQETRKTKDKLQIVKRFDPNAPESESESESEIEAGFPDASPDHVLLGSLDNVTAAAEQTETVDPQLADEGEEDDEDEPLPSFLRPQADVAEPADLTSIFKLKAQDEQVSFRFAAEEEDAEAEKSHADDAMPDVSLQMEGMHPDRMTRSALAEEPQEEFREENANYTALAKDRGFNLTTGTAIAKDAAPAFFMMGPGSRWATQRGLFDATLNHEAIKMRLEESRVEATRDWKRKERESNKQMRKATNRHG